MFRKSNSVLLRIVAILLLCSLAFTGCFGAESRLPEKPVTNEENPVSDVVQDIPSGNTEGEISTTAHEHTFNDATCTTAKTCSVCEATEGKPLGHTWTEATCTAPSSCSVCGEVNGDEKGHNWKPATCDTPITCETCGQKEGNPLDHNWKKATCTTPSTCEYCGQTKGTVIDHNWKEASCTAAATCIVCGETKGSAAEHKWKSATCTTPKTCKVCGKTKGSTASHKYAKGSCSVCGDKDPSYSESSSTMVWIPTNGGKKYHSHSGCSNMKNPEKVSLSKAKRLGFTACKKCY